MVGDRPRICAVITGDNPQAVKGVESLVDLFEVRIDLIGGGWRRVVENIGKPWIACNRSADEGGSWQGSESKRIDELIGAIGLGAAVVDIELATPDVAAVVGEIKGRADCLLSCHDFEGTPPPEKMRDIVRRQLAAGADICKLVTTARSFSDNMAVLELAADFPGTKIVSFAMGALGYVSRIFCPLVGGYFTYASVEEGMESADGQIAVNNLRKIYGMLKDAG